MIPQLGIALFGVLAIFLANCLDIRLRRWASVAGLIGQPFWFFAALDAQQWGILALTGLYTLAWAKGFRDTFWPFLRSRYFGGAA
jgi:hypothetical protein